MLKKQIKIGNSYRAKVSNVIVTVRILREASYGSGWVALNLKTNREVRIKSAAKLRSEVAEAPEQTSEAQCPFCGEQSPRCDCDF